MESAWPSQKMNLRKIKNSFGEKDIFLSVPTLIVGVQKIAFTERLTDDIDCSFQDPTCNFINLNITI